MAILSVVHAVLWQHPPYPDADRLVAVDADFGPARATRLSPGELLALRSASQTLTHLATANGVADFVTVDDVMERVPGLSASDDMLGLAGGVALGRAPSARLDHRDGVVTGVAIDGS